MSAPQWAPLDDETHTLLDTLAHDWRPFAEDDRNLIAQAIRDDAEAHGGSIDPNRVRRAVLGRVQSQRIGQTYRALRLAGVIATDGYGENRDKSGNAGKPALRYRWIGGEA